MILNTGPTGSGKTTTLYVFLRQKAKPEIKIERKMPTQKHMGFFEFLKMKFTKPAKPSIRPLMPTTPFRVTPPAGPRISPSAELRVNPSVAPKIIPPTPQQIQARSEQKPPAVNPPADFKRVPIESAKPEPRSEPKPDLNKPDDIIDLSMFK